MCMYIPKYVWFMLVIAVFMVRSGCATHLALFDTCAKLCFQRICVVNGVVLFSWHLGIHKRSFVQGDVHTYFLSIYMYMLAG